MKFYHMFTILFTAIALPFSVMDAQGNFVNSIEICENEFHSQSIYKIPKSFLISLLVFQAFSLLIMLLSFKKRQEAPIRTRYIKHHRVILFTLALVWLFPIVTNVFLLYEIDKSSTLFNVFNIMSFFSLVCSGGIVNVVRFINDRYLWKQIRKMFQRRKKRRGNRVPQASEVDDDVWNVCLANAVSMFQNQ